jgi:hypothetical protein
MFFSKRSQVILLIVVTLACCSISRRSRRTFDYRGNVRHTGATEKEKIDKAKAVNYGILFQMTADGLSRELNKDRKTAQGYMNAFWAKYSVAKKYLDDYVESLANEGHEVVIRSYLGRIRRFKGELPCFSRWKLTR